MKKLFVLFLAGFTLTAGIVNAQFRKVPERVNRAFEHKYPAAKNVDWKDKIGSFQANFDIDGNRYEARFDKRGHWKETEVTVTEYNLPMAVKNGLRQSKYRSWKIRSTHVLYLADGKTHYHIIAAKNDFNKKDLVFNKRGQLLSDDMTI